MANNKVIANGETLIDLTEDTVTPSTMIDGIVAHDASGVRIVGTFDPTIFVQKSGDTMTGDLNLTDKNVYIQSASGERLFRITTQAGGNVSLCYGSSLKHGIYSSGYETSLTNSNTYTPSGLWVIARGSDGKVDIPNWASIGSSTEPVYLDSDGRPVSIGNNPVKKSKALANTDNRTNNEAPSTFMSNSPYSLTYDFKKNSSIGLTDLGTTFSSVFTVTPWGDNSGGRPTQIAVDENGYLAVRTANSDSAWNNWRMIDRSFHDIRIKTTSNNNAKISIDTLLNYLITNKYIPVSGYAVHVTIQVEFAYAYNDILKFTNENGLVYETTLAGALIEVEGKITAYNAGVFRVKIYTPPSDNGYTLDSGSTRLAPNSVVLYTFNGTSYYPIIKIVDFADVVYTGSIGGSSSDTFASALNTWFNNNKTKIPRNVGLSVYSSAYGNGAQGFGYLINGYDSSPYGGFFMCHYNWPKYVGISGGTYTQHNIVTDQTSIGRTEFTPTYGTAGNPTKCWYAKYGKVVEVAMRVSGIAADNNNHQLYTLPSGYRPPTMIAIQAHGTGTNGAAPGNITDEGIIIVKGIYSTVDIHAVFLTT